MKGKAVIEHSDGAVLSVRVFAGKGRLKRARKFMRELMWGQIGAEELDNGRTVKDCLKSGTFTSGKYDILIVNAEIDPE